VDTAQMKKVESRQKGKPEKALKRLQGGRLKSWGGGYQKMSGCAHDELKLSKWKKCDLTRRMKTNQLLP
jgi:hypothetical protein